MKLHAAVTLLRLLNSQPQGALTTNQIALKWSDLTGAAINIRNIQRYLSELSADSADGPALVDVLDDNKERKYYLRLSQVAQWFMTEQAALDVLLTRQVLERSFSRGLDPAEAKRHADLAERVSGDSVRTRRLRERLRIVPDGIGRLPARVDEQILASAMDAVAASQKLSFTYVDSKGKESKQVLSPQAMVAKDGTIYLLATKGLSEPPRHFALHRVTEAHVVPHPLQARPDFKLDVYIQDSHQLSHRLNAEAPPVSLKLRVAPDALFHFTERPLSSDQSIGPARRSDGWHLVTATVPETILLVPFLLSMGPWIEVLGPPSVRSKTAQWLRDAAAHYASHASE
jgi:predicted DNA-binding transcriptional regulator YafY